MRVRLERIALRERRQRVNIVPTHEGHGIEQRAAIIVQSSSLHHDAETIHAKLDRRIDIDAHVRGGLRIHRKPAESDNRKNKARRKGKHPAGERKGAASRLAPLAT